MTPIRRKPGRLDRLRRWTLGGLVGAIGLHLWAWYGLGWQGIGKLSFSGLASLLVGHLNAAALFCLVLGVALVFTGRLFCGWACKLSAFQELAEGVYRRVGFRPRFVHTRARAIRLFIFVPYFLPVLYTWNEVGLSTAYADLGAVQPWTADLPRTVLATVFYFASITFVLTAAFGRRAFCRLVCPFALFFQLFERLPWLPRVRQVGRCIDCDVCERACPMGISVPNEIQRAGEVLDPECIRCMVCVDVCPVKALRFGLPGSAFPIQRPDLAPVVRESAFSPLFDASLATLAVIGGVWAATQISGFHVFLGASWGLIAGLLGRSAFVAWRGKEAGCST
ncbi:MAG: 4Fe-4S binding protein [Pseudomonadota bacterium]|nr:4Fe-4S binding protein [Pseudomonadota bacterium]